MRIRSTNAQLEALDEAIIQAAQLEHPVTLRGIFYRVVSAGAVEKTEAGYRKVGRQLLKLRQAKRIPYYYITDGTRWIVKPTTWSDVDTMLDNAAASYRRDLWNNQNADVRIFTEKDAISGVISPITSKWDVPLGVLRGYSSETFSYEMAESIAASIKPVFVYQLGDHDPSGLDAWRSFQEKVTGFLDQDFYGSSTVKFERLAVLPEQVEELQLPTRPTKSTDTRAKKFDGESIEVDAIPPRYLRSLIEEAITQHIDQDAFNVTQMVERNERELLMSIRSL